MRILILEDEIPANKKLVAYLTDYFGDSIFLESARTVKDGIKLLNNDSGYDLILSDIKLLDGTAFEIFQEVGTKIPIIFCTAYDEHLLQAFQMNGIAYILKPYQRKDLEAALKKFQILFEPKTLDRDIFQKLKEVLGTKDENYKKRFAIKKRDGIKLLDASQISLIQANGDFCKIVDSQGHLHSISKSIGILVDELDPKHFFKINRSQIVGIEHIEKISPYSKNRLAISLMGTKEHAITSTSTTKEFRKWLEN
ncbi:MAG TPA: response regulator transcription factor [Pricia antarctica]|uniref:Response regulator transcription factor n=1 Tax=Pricia antarctica TaxID=641691 RepID=A0A831VND9_9FLAO|nr:response regulator transcription factor [Pricia antarctica]